MDCSVGGGKEINNKQKRNEWVHEEHEEVYEDVSLPTERELSHEQSVGTNGNL